MRLRKTAAVSVLALAAGSIGFIAPATAATDSLPYECNVPILGKKTFNTTAAVTPATVQFGQKFTVGAEVTVPKDLGDTAYSLLQAREFGGNAVVNFDVSGAAKKLTLPIPSTKIVKGQDTVVKPSLKVAADKVGSATYTIGDYEAQMQIKKADGTESPFTIPCAAPAEGNKVAGTVNVTKASTTSKIKVKGAKKKATVKVTVKGKFGTKATGKVTIKVKQGKKTKTVKAKLKRGVATATVKKLKKGKIKVTSVYKGDKNHLGSKGKGAGKVK